MSASRDPRALYLQTLGIRGASLASHKHSFSTSSLDREASSAGQRVDRLTVDGSADALCRAFAAEPSLLAQLKVSSDSTGRDTGQSSKFLTGRRRAAVWALMLGAIPGTHLSTYFEPLQPENAAGSDSAHAHTISNDNVDFVDGSADILALRRDEVLDLARATRAIFPDSTDALSRGSGAVNASQTDHGNHSRRRQSGDESCLLIRNARIAFSHVAAGRVSVGLPSIGQAHTELDDPSARRRCNVDANVKADDRLINVRSDVYAAATVLVNDALLKLNITKTAGECTATIDKILFARLFIVLWHTVAYCDTNLIGYCCCRSQDDIGNRDDGVSERISTVARIAVIFARVFVPTYVSAQSHEICMASHSGSGEYEVLDGTHTNGCDQLLASDSFVVGFHAFHRFTQRIDGSEFSTNHARLAQAAAQAAAAQVVAGESTSLDENNAASAQTPWFWQLELVRHLVSSQDALLDQHVVGHGMTVAEFCSPLVQSALTSLADALPSDHTTKSAEPVLLRLIDSILCLPMDFLPCAVFAVLNAKTVLRSGLMKCDSAGAMVSHLKLGASMLKKLEVERVMKKALEVHRAITERPQPPSFA